MHNTAAYIWTSLYSSLVKVQFSLLIGQSGRGVRAEGPPASFTLYHAASWRRWILSGAHIGCELACGVNPDVGSTVLHRATWRRTIRPHQSSIQVFSNWKSPNAESLMSVNTARVSTCLRSVRSLMIWDVTKERRMRKLRDEFWPSVLTMLAMV